MLLMEDWKGLLGRWEFAEERLRKHQVNELARRKAGLRTDLERYVAGDQVKD